MTMSRPDHQAPKRAARLKVSPDGQTIAALRTFGGMTVEELAQRSGIPAELIEGFENGEREPSPGTLSNLLQATVNPDDQNDWWQ